MSAILNLCEGEMIKVDDLEIDLTSAMVATGPVTPLAEAIPVTSGIDVRIADCPVATEQRFFPSISRSVASVLGGMNVNPGR